MAMPFQYLSLVYCSVEKLMHQRPNPIRFFFQREMARIEGFYSLEEVRALLTQASGREHLVLRIFINCGLRPGELFALREDDVEPGQLRIDEAVKETERGECRISDTKTTGSRGYVACRFGHDCI
jgi:integrase